MLPVDEAGRLLHAGNRRGSVWLDFLRAGAPHLAERVEAGSIRSPLRGTIALPQPGSSSRRPGLGPRRRCRLPP